MLIETRRTSQPGRQNADAIIAEKLRHLSANYAEKEWRREGWGQGCVEANRCGERRVGGRGVKCGGGEEVDEEVAMFYADHCETERSISCHCGKGIIAGGIQLLVESIMCSEFGGGLRRRESMNQGYCIALRSALTKGNSQFQFGKYSGRCSTLQSVSFYPSSSCACKHFCTINTHSLNTSSADRQGFSDLHQTK